MLDVIGNIAILPLQKKAGKRRLKKAKSGLKKQALQLLKQKNIKTVLLKKEKFKGRLRKIKTEFLAGINTKETIHHENGCRFKLNVDETYFSPRLSGERLEIAEIVKKQKKKKILVLFAGIAPFSIVIAKFNNKAKIYSVELNRIASRYAEENVKLNKLLNVKIVQGDAKKIKNLIKKYKMPEKYDCIVMPRPQLPSTFLKEAFSVASRGCLIFFYDFVQEEGVAEAREKIGQEAGKNRRKIKILNLKKAGEIAPFKFRVRIDFVVA